MSHDIQEMPELLTYANAYGFILVQCRYLAASTFLSFSLREVRREKTSRSSLKLVNFKQTYPVTKIFHVWWTYLVNHTGLRYPLHSVRFNFCASGESTERPVAGRPRRLSLTIHRQKSGAPNDCFLSDPLAPF